MIKRMRQMNKKQIFAIIGVLVLAILGIYFVDLVVLDSGVQTKQGVIIYDHSEGYERWGLEIKEGIFSKRILLISDLPIETRQEGTINLPAEFKKAGSNVRCTYVISDVIGLRDWSTVISLIDIESVM